MRRHDIFIHLLRRSLTTTHTYRVAMLITKLLMTQGCFIMWSADRLRELSFCKTHSFWGELKLTSQVTWSLTSDTTFWNLFLCQIPHCVIRMVLYDQPYLTWGRKQIVVLRPPLSLCTLTQATLPYRLDRNFYLGPPIQLCRRYMNMC